MGNTNLIRTTIYLKNFTGLKNKRENIMKTVKDKYLVVGADFAGFPLKEVVVEHLEKKG